MKKIMLYIVSSIFAVVLFVGGGFLFVLEQNKVGQMPEDFSTTTNLVGDGSAENPYLISSQYDLADLLGNAGAGEYALQIADIDITEDYIAEDLLNLTDFEIQYDGNGCAISQTIFGGLGIYGSIQNLIVETGPVVSLNQGYISNCAVYGFDILDDTYTSYGDGRAYGGICNINNGTIEACTNFAETMDLNGSLSGGDVVGGIVGVNYGIITDCANFANIIADGACSYGGIVGRWESEGTEYIERCVNYGRITIESCPHGVYAGGIVGEVTSTCILSYCYNLNTVFCDCIQNYSSCTCKIAGLCFDSERGTAGSIEESYYGYLMEALNYRSSYTFLQEYHAGSVGFDLTPDAIPQYMMDAPFSWGVIFDLSEVGPAYCPSQPYFNTDTIVGRINAYATLSSEGGPTFSFAYRWGGYLEVDEIYNTSSAVIYGIAGTYGIFYQPDGVEVYYPVVSLTQEETVNEAPNGFWTAKTGEGGDQMVERNSHILSYDYSPSWTDGDNGIWYSQVARIWVGVTFDGNGGTVHASYRTNGDYSGQPYSESGSTLQMYAALNDTDLSVFSSDSEGFTHNLDLYANKSGMICTGFWTAATGGTKVMDNHASALNTYFSSETPVTYYAQYEQDYTAIILNEAGGSLSIEYNGTTADVGTAITVYIKGTTLYYYTDSTYYEITGISASRTGHTYKGIYTADSGGTQVIGSNACSFTSSYSGSGGETYYAQWEAKYYAFKLNPNSGTVTVSYGSSSTVTVSSSGTTFYGRYGYSSFYYKSGSTYYSVTAISASRSYYTYKGIYTASSGGTQKITSTGYTFSSGWSSTSSSTTYYAQWTPRSYTQTILIYTINTAGTSSNSATGGKVTVSYTNSSGTSTSATLSSASGAYSARYSTSVTLTATANSGYVFVGFGTTVPSPTSTPSVTTSWTVSGTKSMYAYFQAVSNNQLQYDSTDKYYYFEDGYFPQSYVGDTANTWLSNNVNLAGETWEINGYELALGNNITYNGTTVSGMLTKGTAYDFARLTMDSDQYWFLFEPIRWRVSDYGVENTPSNWATYGMSKSEFTVVSDTVLWASVFSDTALKTVGDTSLDASINDIFGQMTSLNTSDFGTFSYLSTDGVTIDVDTYNSESSSTKVTNSTTTLSDGSLRVASLADIDENLSDFKAKASDLVATILGQSSYVNYWTRNLGQYYSNGNYVLVSGAKQNDGRYDNVMGVRFAMTMTEGSRY